jgi:uncharacterized protein (TIGR02145 family)
MNKFIIYIVAIAMMSAISGAYAQVTIGGLEDPKNGALLDLNSSFKGGLLLPNVEITDLGKIPATFSDASIQGADVAVALSGLVVYNTNEVLNDNIRIGFYYWDGYDWKLLAVDSGKIHIPSDIRGYDPASPLGADDNNEVAGIPITNPGLDIEGAYTFSIIAGSDYAAVSPQSSYDPEFTVNFMPNLTSLPRKAIVLVTDPGGKTGTFVFTQDGSACETPVDVTVATLRNTNSFCSGGSVHAFVSAVSDGMINSHEYFWTLNGIAVAEGTGVELRHAGSYKVYADKIGCGTPATVVITGPESGITATNAPHILVDNEGIMCGSGGGVRLSALNAPSSGTIYWMKDGLMKATGGTYYDVISTPGNEGIWYAVYYDDACLSTSSNKVTVSYRTDNSTLDQIQATINDTPIDATGTVVCAGGTLKLEVLNASQYPGGTFEWFANGESLGRTTEAKMYVVPPSVTKLLLSLTVSASGTCPMSVTSPEFTVTQSDTPPATSINSGDEFAYICGTNSAQLQASNASGKDYEWFWNNVQQSEHSALFSATVPGKYSVRYKTAGGCWSTVSQEITVVQSSQLTAVWAVAPAPVEVIGSNKTYSIVVAPEAQRFEWAPENPLHAEVASITLLGNGSSASVHYNELASGMETLDYRIRVTAYNVCGNTEAMSDTIEVKHQCIPAGSLVITPNSAQTVTEGETVNFTASANTGSDDSSYPMTYTWMVNETVIKTSSGDQDKKKFAYAFNSVGNHAVQVKVQTAGCGTEIESKTINVTVKVNPHNAASPTAEQNTRFYGSKSCLDVHQTGDIGTNSWAGDRLPLNVRPNDFNSGSTLSFDYIFTGTGISNIRFVTSDAQNIVESVSGDVNASTATAHLTFKRSVIAGATGKTGPHSLKTVLYAVYNDNSAGTANYKDSIVITVRDGACGCPAKSSANTWQMWSCHHLGANINANPFVFSEATHGYYWKFGVKGPAATYTATPDAGTELSDGERTYTVDRSPGTNTDNVNWALQNDPCPYGWHIASQTEWQNFGANNAGVYYNGDSGNIDNGWLFGLYWPMVAHGYRVYSTNGTGNLTDTEASHHWTSTSHSNIQAINAIKYATDNTWWHGGAAASSSSYNKNYQESVRCVSNGASYTGN